MKTKSYLKQQSAWWRWWLIWGLLAYLCSPGFVSAGVFRCVESGRVVFQDQPCTWPKVGVATEKSAPTAAPAVATDKNRTLFWRLDRGQTRFYLLGSIHFGRAEMYPLPAPIMQAFAAADALVVEINMTAIDPFQVAQLFAVSGMYPPGESLRQHLDEVSWQRLVKAMAKLGAPEQLVTMQKPWLAALTLESLSIKQAGYNEELGVDLYFLNQAAGKKKIIELESAAKQAELLAGLSETAQLAMLRDSLRVMDDSKEYYQRMLSAWSQGNGAALEDLMDESFGVTAGEKEIETVLMTARNKGMTEGLERLAKQGGTYFVVLGAGHFVGHDGIVEQLKQKGFAVQQQ
ncbi:MAG: TraB/GumN family protein [Gammaproteobacteria bacterium]|nr:TraB/GumN family protein [Gammaproteobacteria bacterium]